MNTKELQHHIAYIKIAENIANLSYCKRKQVGSVIVKDNNIISTGYNGTPASMPNVCENTEGETNWYTLHSETNCLSKIARSTQSSENSVLYLTLSPCKDCAKLILQSGIKEIYYLVEHSCKSGLELLILNNVKCFSLTKEIKNLIEEDKLNTYEKFICKEYNDNDYYDSEFVLINSILIDKFNLTDHKK